MIEVNDFLLYLALCAVTLVGVVYAIQVNRISKLEKDIEEIQKINNINSKDSSSLEKLIDAFNTLKESNNEMVSNSKLLDSHVRHEIANMQQTVTSFNKRFEIIEKENEEYSSRLNRIERKLNIE